VIFVCVKSYSIDETIPFLKEAAGPDTMVIPILNIFGTGSQIQKHLPDTTVTDGCIYVASEIKEPGHIWMNGTILRVVLGLRKDQKHLEAEAGPLLERVRDDLCSAGIAAVRRPRHRAAGCAIKGTGGVKEELSRRCFFLTAEKHRSIIKYHIAT
jgi:2-dehydropantoate 2-reductase